MVKTHPNSKFVLKDLDGIRDSSEVILQIDKTESTFKDSSRTVYLCETVSQMAYDNTVRRTVDTLVNEISKVNAENRRLLSKISRIEKDLLKATQ